MWISPNNLGMIPWITHPLPGKDQQTVLPWRFYAPLLSIATHIISVRWFKDCFQYLAVLKRLWGWEVLGLVINRKGLNKYPCSIYLWKDKRLAFLQHHVLGTSKD